MSDSVSSSIEGEDVDDQAVQEFQERLEIVEKYDKGCKGQQVDPWENPDFELYRITDRYGFMHDDDARADEYEERAKMLELKRENKWLKMIQDWHKYEDSIKLRRRIFKGVPDKFRAEVWRRLLELDMNKQANVYEQLKDRARLVSKDLKQIDLDINRTYRNHLFFRRRYDMKQQSLFHVLAAYAMFNTQVGYCQGMSQVAAVLLMYFDEEDAFWALHTLMCDEAHAMHGFFVPGFPKLLRFQQHHDRILKKMLPRLKKHIDKHDIYSALYTTKWFFQCFLDRVPFTLALRLWDIFIMDGDVVLSGMAYNIMKMHSKRLLKMNFEQTMDFLQIRLEQSFGFPSDVVIEQLRASMAELRRSKLLEAPPPDKTSEKPSKPFGEILKTPYDELKRSMSVALSRKGRSSRSPSFSSSLPVTPRHRSTSPSKSAPGPVTLAPLEPSLLPKPMIHRQHQQQSHPMVITSTSQDPKQYQDTSSPMTTSSANTSGGSTTTLEANGDLGPYRRSYRRASPISVDSPGRSIHQTHKMADPSGRPIRQAPYQAKPAPRYFTSDGDVDLSVVSGGVDQRSMIRGGRNVDSGSLVGDGRGMDHGSLVGAGRGVDHGSLVGAGRGMDHGPMISTTRGLDHVDHGSQPGPSTGLKHTDSFYDNVPGMDKASTQEYIEYDSGKNQYGGVTYTTQYTRTSETVTTTRRPGDDGYMIRTGPDYVTRIEVDNDVQFNGKGTGLSQTGRPARFPISPNAYNRFDSPLRGMKTPPPDY